MDNNNYILSINYGTINPMAWTLWKYSDENKEWHIIDCYYYDARKHKKSLTDNEYVDIIISALFNESNFYTIPIHCDVLLEQGLSGFMESFLRKSRPHNISVSFKTFFPIHALQSKVLSKSNMQKYIDDINHYQSELPSHKNNERMIESIFLATYYINNYCSERLEINNLLNNKQEAHMGEIKYEYIIYLDGREVATIKDDQFIATLLIKALFDECYREPSLMITIERNIMDNESAAPQEI